MSTDGMHVLSLGLQTFTAHMIISTLKMDGYPSLIRRAIDCDGKLVVWGDGSAVRDFIYASDVVAGTLTMIENNIQEPVNLGRDRNFNQRTR